MEALTPEQLKALAERLADEAQAAGAAYAIVAVGYDTTDGHSLCRVSARGACLPVEGLACTALRRIRSFIQQAEPRNGVDE